MVHSVFPGICDDNRVRVDWLAVHSHEVFIGIGIHKAESKRGAAYPWDKLTYSLVYGFGITSTKNNQCKEKAGENGFFHNLSKQSKFGE